MNNPILPPHSADPWMIFHGGFYYYCQSTPDNRAIAIRTSASIAGIGQDARTVVWRAPVSGRTSRSLWAPELHFIDGKWFIYYAADDGQNANHRMWVLEAEGPNPLGPYR